MFAGHDDEFHSHEPAEISQNDGQSSYVSHELLQSQIRLISQELTAIEVLRDASIASSGSQRCRSIAVLLGCGRWRSPTCLLFARASLVIALARDAYFLYSPLSERRDHKKNTAVQLALAIFHVGGWEVNKLKD